MAGSPTRRRRALAALLLPATLVLAGCVRMDVAMELYEDDTAELAMTVIDKSGFMFDSSMGGLESCDDLLSGELVAEDGPEFTVAEITDDADNRGCEITSERAAINEEFDEGSETGSIRREGDVYHVEFPALVSASDADQMPGLELSYAFTFPGEVIEAGGGTVSEDGRTVTISGEDAYENVAISGEASTGASMGLILGIAVVALLVIGAVVAFVVRRKPRAAAAGAVPADQVPGYPGAPAPGQPAFPTAQGGYQQPVAPGGHQQPFAPGGYQQPYAPGGHQQPFAPGGHQQPFAPTGGDQQPGQPYAGDQVPPSTPGEQDRPQQ